ncbi:MAG: 1-(5-phosphoribosyl)-5-[(5-phosphoribosylamino)methylideneamino]imidazole-4-carboxamide isomerase [Clostridiales bacterium]|jgi:phosphoribosylformimino-5-aminoimidazole carboxamide ribotide isomerase|nr:1-(5-phosphoribosyl)-5-[(5-phosphoribosylamino)methylideneamino]imidazole-4-carboxamide isomerase [Clostridiales bacterium]
MIIYPAIDIKEGRCVRLLQGRAEDETVYSSNPAEVARTWEKQGAEYLHVVDLDGAFRGESPNEQIIKTIAGSLSIPIQVGGGIRSMDKIQLYLEEYGVERVILGTAAIENKELLKQAVDKYGSRIAVGIDARDGKAAVKGWVETTDISAADLGRRMKEIGIDTAVYTDIAKDGMMRGPNIKETREMIEQTGLNIIASGGISCLSDLQQILEIGAAGAIIGQALYTGKIDLASALMIGRKMQ